MLAVGRRKEAAFLNGIESLTMPASGMLLAGFVFTPERPSRRSTRRGSASCGRAVPGSLSHAPRI